MRGGPEVIGMMCDVEMNQMPRMQFVDKEDKDTLKEQTDSLKFFGMEALADFVNWSRLKPPFRRKNRKPNLIRRTD